MLERLVDSSFDRHIDMLQLRCAWHTLDADALIDFAMDVLVVENRLLRKHRTGLDGKSILLVALQIASERRLKEPTVRIGEVASQFNLPSLVSASQEATEQMAESDAFSSEELSVAELQEIQAQIQEIIAAGIRGDGQSLATILASVSEESRKHLGDRFFREGSVATSPEVVDTAHLLDEVVNEVGTLTEPGYEKDDERINGEFDVPANARNGVLFRNWSNRRRGLCFTGKGLWTYHPRQGFHGPGGHPRNTAGGSYMLPGHPAGGLIALGVPQSEGFKWVGAGELRVVMDPYGAFKFFCNDDYNGFGDNRGAVRIRWAECVWGPIVG